MTERDGANTTADDSGYEMPPSHRDPGLELFGGGDGDAGDPPASTTTSYTGRHRAPEV